MMFPKPIKHKKFMEKTPKKRRDPGKKPTYSQAMRTADDMFSRLVRTKWAIETGILGECEIDRAGWFRCVTCGKITGILSNGAGQCGHFIPRGNMTLRYDERNTGAQCGQCNATDGGQWPRFQVSIRERLGERVLSELIKIGETNPPAGYTARTLIEMAIDFQDRAMRLWENEELPYPWPKVNLRKQLELFGRGI